MADQAETPEHANLTAALIAAQEDFEAVVKGTINPHFNKRYADLATVLAAIKPALLRHGILLTQPIVREDDGLVLQTILTHISGEVMLSEVPLPMPTNWQRWGSDLTYARRYTVMALVGAAPEDDDGNDATGVQPRAVAHETRGVAIDDARKAELVRKARAEPATEATTVGEQSKADVAHERFMKALQGCGTLGELAELQLKLGKTERMLGERYQECAVALQAKVREMNVEQDHHDVFAELEPEEWRDQEGRIEDERQPELLP